MKRFCSLIFSCFLLFGVWHLALAVTDSVDVTQTVTGCNNDGSCTGLETTANCPNDCPAEVPPGGGGGPLRDTTLPGIYDLIVQPTDISAIISWKTTKPARSTFYWGLTEEYEMGTISEIDFLEEHRIFLSDLTPDTVYHYQIFLRDEATNENYTYDQQFRTLVMPDVIPPANVSDFTAERFEEENAAELTWENPVEPDLAGIRVVRSTKFFPADIYDGTTVYEGPGEFTIDPDIETGVKYYYSAFAYDLSGNYSSGAIALFLIYEPGVPPPIIPPVIPPVVPPEEVPPEIEKINLDYFEFFQKGQKLPFVGERVYIDAGESLEIALNYEKAPEILKTILVTLIEPSDEKKSFSFLLRINKEGDAYEAKLAPLKKPGLYEVSIAVLDYKNQALKKIKTFLWVEGQVAAVVEKAPFKFRCGWICWLIIILIILLILYLITRKRKKKEEQI